jgi:Amino acid permease
MTDKIDVSGGPPGIGGGMAIALFSYLGVETAAVAAAKVRNPDRNIPRATILGTIATAVVYMLSLIAVFGIVPTSKLANATALLSDAVNAIFGGTWAGNVMAVAVIIFVQRRHMAQPGPCPPTADVFRYQLRGDQLCRSGCIRRWGGCAGCWCTGRVWSIRG